MRMFLVALVSAACTVPAAPVSSPSAGASRSGIAREVERGLAPPVPKLRLPRNFLPTSYAARLAIDPARAGFDGTVAITGEVAERSSVIWLHGKQLAIQRAVAARGSARATLTVTPHGEDLLELRAQPALEAGAWTLTLDYAGVVNEVNSDGVFRQTAGGAPYVYTQLEATDARRAFPCFDEPDSKVPWQLTLEVPSSLIAVSNTPVVRETALAGGRKRVEFAATKPLPSYLIAFGVGPFDIVDAGKTKSGTPVRIVTMKGRAPDAAWAAETSARLTDLLEEFFGSPYPFEKLDMLTIPTMSGAMEHPGLITYGESIMLSDPERGSRARAYDWVTVAAHELAHQWFGNLVTMAWWDDIWLNEGFATWVESKISARFEPAWREEVSEVDVRNGALEADSLVSARQVRQPIVGPDDILNALDRITYNKGASVLNMFERHVGQDVFLRGVRAYLKQHAFGNATSADLFKAISEAAGKDVGAAFSSFLEQPGAPELTATLVCEPGQRPAASLRQQRYVPAGAPAAEMRTPWIVPVCVAFERDGKRAEACTLLSTQTGSLALEATRCPRWLMPNVDGRGYYRSRYTAGEVEALRDRAWAELRPTERHALSFDVSEAALQGQLPLPLALSFVPRLAAAGDRDRFSLIGALAVPLGVMEFVPRELRARYEGWLRTTFGPAARRAGLVPQRRESFDVERARNRLVGAAGAVGHDPGLIAEAVKLAGGWRELPEAIRGQVVSLAAHASPAVFERLREEVYTEPDRVRRRTILYALASNPDVDRQRAALALVLDPKLDIKDTRGMLYGAYGPANRLVSQQFFRDHQQAILDRLPETSRAWLAYVFTASCSAERRAEIVEYVTRTFAKLPGGVRVVQQAIEGMDQCIARKQLLEPGIRAWLGR